MDETTARSIIDGITKVGDSAAYTFQVESLLEEGQLGGTVHSWLKAAEVLSALEVSDPEGAGYIIVAVDLYDKPGYRDKVGHHLLLFPERQKPTLIELRRELREDDLHVLEWRYKPTKRDKKNEQRRVIFEEAVGGLVVHLDVPATTEEAAVFLEKLFALAESRTAADELCAEGFVDPPLDRYPEGAVRIARHLHRERNRKLVEDAKDYWRSRGEPLQCSVCGFDFLVVYGKRGDGYIEAHHTRPISTLSKTTTMKVKDLEPVCSNCHRMIHRYRPWLTTGELKKIRGTSG